ncbi:MAG TPA: hypothetical protein VHF67_09965 [Gaiellaceae bacterium]|nr:hypothetical protein [Gaiellaceae bacterium]
MHEEAVVEVAAFVGELAERFTVVEAVVPAGARAGSQRSWEQRGIAVRDVPAVGLADDRRL